MQPLFLRKGTISASDPLWSFSDRLARQVRCDGNKQGCCRCLEKRLSCVYSESRVGKVVGKRRKRPIDDSIGNINSKSWVVTTIPIQSIPSPATTQTPEDHSKRQSSQPPWATFIPTPGEPGFLTFDEPIDSLNAVDMTDHRSLSMASEFAFFNNSGLPTPALSPPHLSRYLSPAQLDSHPSLKGASTPSVASRLSVTRTISTPIIQKSDTFREDQEMVCIKLLAHLKKHGSDQNQPREAQLELLRKSNAAVSRILGSRTIRSEYSCHLLLSSIIIQLVRICERLCQGDPEENLNTDSQFLQDQMHFVDAMPGYFDHGVPQTTNKAEYEYLAMLVQEVMAIVSTVGDLLKMKPLQPFQYLGRHETLHVELECRLREASMLLH